MNVSSFLAAPTVVRNGPAGLTQVNQGREPRATLAAIQFAGTADMYRNILVSTDGSKLSAKAIRTAAQLAEALGAKITGVYVISPYPAQVYGEVVAYAPQMTAQRSVSYTHLTLPTNSRV